MPSPPTHATSAHLELLREVQATAVIIVPLAAPTRTLGAITLVSSESSRRLTQADLGLAVRLGRRAGTAVENARLYTERTRIAHTLQRALLPESLAEIPGVEIQTLYAAAGELNEVGGDFYDVFDYDEDRTMLVIGDVCGKGPRAAGCDGAGPPHPARRGDRRPVAHRDARDPPSGAAAPAAGGGHVHRLPDRARARGARRAADDRARRASTAAADRRGGEVEQVGHSGTILGVVDPLSIEESEITLAAGETLLLYTDGVIEAGRPDRLLGEDGLLELCAAAPELALEGFLEHIERAALQRAQGRPARRHRVAGAPRRWVRYAAGATPAPPNRCGSV